MAFTPYDWQRKDLDYLRENNYVALLNLGTGAGKTALSTWAIGESGSEVTLVVCPAQTMESAWIPTVKELLGIDAKEIGNSNKAKRSAMTAFEFGVPGVYLVTPQLMARTDTTAWSGDMLILDEAHGVMTPKSKSQRVLSGSSVQEAEQALCRRFQYRLALSGTALRNKFQLAWSYGRTLWWWLYRRDEIAYDNLWLWEKDRMKSYQQPVGDGKNVTVFTGESEPGRWVSEAPCVITHLKRERCCEYHPNGYLPLNEPTVIHETIPLLPAQKKAIHELETQFMTYLNDNPMVTVLPITKAQRIRQMTLGVPTVNGEGDVFFETDCKSPFLDRVFELLDNEIAEETAILYTDSQKFARVAVDRLNAAGISAFEYSGQTRSVRDENVKLLGTKYRVMVGVLAAAGTGLDTLQQVCKNEIWLSRDLDETINEQGTGRLDRIGQTGQVMRWIFHDDLGLSEGNYGKAIEKRLQLNRSLRRS